VTNSTPKVSIGVPVYNGERTLRAALESLVNQTFSDFEIIISDNASNDGTEAICKEYMARDPRIRYVRQSSNIGPIENFKWVLDAAKTEYFMWSAADDVRSNDYLGANVEFLEDNPSFVASTSPNLFEGQDASGPDLVVFGLEGTIEERFNAFFDNCWKSHGIFYALARTKVLKECTELKENYLGPDWAVILFLASRGNIHRSQTGLIIFGANGASSDSSIWRASRTSPLSWLLPFYRLSIYAINLSSDFSWAGRLILIKRLIGLNVFAAWSQLNAEFYPFYRKYIKFWSRGAKA
jgi:glycosyltransferase involved in cell wall biosynthesis